MDLLGIESESAYKASSAKRQKREGELSLAAREAVSHIESLEATLRRLPSDSFTARAAVLADVLQALHTVVCSPGAGAAQVADAAAKAAGACPEADLSLDAWRSLAWVCAMAGRPHEEVFGRPPVTASVSSSTTVWKALQGQRSSHASLASWPFPLLWLPAWLREGEAEELLASAEKLWQPSPLAGLTDESLPPVRTSESAVLAPESLANLRASAVVQALRHRAADLVGLPAEHCEPPQLVRYSAGQSYKPHVDWGHGDDASLFVAGQRVATVLAYLNDVPQGFAGGRTCFSHLGTREEMLRVVPVCGAALVWPNVSAEGLPLFETEHAAEPLEVKGAASTSTSEVKVALNLWIRDRPVPWAQ